MQKYWSKPSEDSFEVIMDKLTELAPANALPDFSRILVVVPGQLWSRNLKAALVRRFPQGVCPPEILTPGSVLRYGMENLRCASAGEQLVIWEHVLNRLKSSNIFRELSLMHHGVCSETDCRNLAKVFFSLRQELVQGGKTIAEAESVLAQDKRWHALTMLESAFTAALKDLNLMDPAEANGRYVSQAAAALLSDQFTHILVAFLPDMPQLLEAKLQQIEARVLLLIHGEESEADKFDAWGRPNEKWREERLPVQEGHLHCVADPEQAALLTLKLATQSGRQSFDPEQSAIVLGKPGFFPAFDEVFKNLRYEKEPVPVKLFSPEGVPAPRLRIAGFLQKLCACLEDENDFSAFHALLQDEAFSGYLRSGNAISENHFLSELDRFALDALPDNVTSAIALLRRKQSNLEVLLSRGKNEVHALNCAADFCKELRKLLKTVFSRPGYPPTLGVSFDDEVNYWTKAIRELQQSPVQAELLSKAEQKLRYLLQDCETASFYPGRDDEAILIYNFLEFPALLQPQLFLVGMNWGIVPALRGNTPYLTDSIRKQLGLEHYESLAALEAYKLITLLKSKPDAHLLTLKSDETNTPLRPAGMLFAGCEEAELLDRAGRCREAEITEVAMVAAAGDKHLGLNLKDIGLQPFFQQSPLVLSVTDFKTYLNSPRRFLLQKVYDIDCPDYANGELDAGAFGSACHAGFEQLSAISDTAAMTEEDYYNILTAGTDDYLYGKCGNPLPFLVDLQREQIRLRLKAAARYFAASQNEFRLLETEYSLNGGNGIPFGGAKLKGKIDRIEYSSASQTLRLVDIKTYNSAAKHSPEEDHLKGRTDKTLYNLQLPLYHQLLLKDDDFWEKHNLNKIDTKIEVGYLLLTADSNVAELKLWENDFMLWSREAESEVKRIVEELEAIRQTGTLPPEPKSATYYDLEPLFVPNWKEAFMEEER